jgi:tetratricopeptide (TPR) repeat protein
MWLLNFNQGALERARAIKQQGNDFFKQQKFEEAIRCYQEAIKVCPAEMKGDIAIFHQNIGAVYDQMVRVGE